MLFFKGSKPDPQDRIALKKRTLFFLFCVSIAVVLKYFDFHEVIWIVVGSTGIGIFFLPLFDYFFGDYIHKK